MMTEHINIGWSERARLDILLTVFAQIEKGMLRTDLPDKTPSAVGGWCAYIDVLLTLLLNDFDLFLDM